MAEHLVDDDGVVAAHVEVVRSAEHGDGGRFDRR